MQITVLSGGVGGARYLTGLLAHLRLPDDTPGHAVTVIGNTADDIVLHGLRVCPDLDTVMYTLGGGIDREQGWGRADDTFTVAAELTAHGIDAQWFTLGDKDVATHIVRTQMLGLGYPLSQVTAALCTRWGLTPQRGFSLLPMSDDPVTTHVVIDRDAAGADPLVPSPEPDAPVVAVHFQEWWVRHHARPRAHRIVAVGAEQATPAPGVLSAIADADVVVVPPSNPVVSIGTILAVPGIRQALRDTAAPVIGLSPIVAGRPVRGMADACLAAVGVPATALAVGGLYADFLDGWLVHPGDHPAESTDTVPETRAALRAVPLLMTDLPATIEIARATLQFAADLGARR